MRHLLFILLISVSFFSCKKKEPPLPITGTPVFKFIGSIGNDSVNYQAGVNNMYMYTGFFKDIQNLLTVKSYFGKDNCSNCEPYLSFEIKDFDVSNTNGLAGTIADLLQGGGTFNSYSLDSILTSTTVEIFHFIPQTNSVSSTYKWNFGDGGTSTMASPTYIFSAGGLNNVQLIRQGGGTIDSLVNTISTDFHSTCRAQFSAYADSSMPGYVYVNGFTPGFNPYAWNYGDGQTGLGMLDTNVYATAGKYIITLTATNSPACTSVFKQKVNTSFFPVMLANYTYTTNDDTINMLVPRINKSAFIITWKKNGKEYKSFKNTHGINQSGNPVFTFTGILPYNNNEHGNKTVLVTGTVDTYLYNQANWQDSIKIKSEQIVLAAAYPD